MHDQPKKWGGGGAPASGAPLLPTPLLGGAKKILGCSSKTCNKAVRGDMGLDSLSSRRDRAKLKWWHNLCTMIYILDSCLIRFGR